MLATDVGILYNEKGSAQAATMPSPLVVILNALKSKSVATRRLYLCSFDDHVYETHKSQCIYQLIIFRFIVKIFLSLFCGEVCRHGGAASLVKLTYVRLSIRSSTLETDDYLQLSRQATRDHSDGRY